MTLKRTDLLSLICGCAVATMWGLTTNDIGLCLIVVVPVLWSLASNRYFAGLILALYSLIATRGFIEGSAVFFDRSIVFGCLLWLGGSLPWFISGILCWQRNLARRIWVGIPLLCLVLAVPPMIVFGWAHPLLASGLWFPTLQLWAVPATLAVIILLALSVHGYANRRSIQYIQYAVLSLVVVQAVWFYRSPNIKQSEQIVTHDTAFDVGTHGRTTTALQALQRQWKMQAMLGKSPQATIDIFPESVGDFMDDFVLSQWQYHLSLYPHKTVIIGGYERTGKQLQAVLFAITADSKTTFYRQRLPMTAGMYNPFTDDGFQPRWFETATQSLNGSRFGVAICFEYVVLLPVMQLISSKPDAVIAVASSWWSPKQLSQAQSQSLRLTARLANVPVFTATNGANQ